MDKENDKKYTEIGGKFFSIFKQVKKERNHGKYYREKIKYKSQNNAYFRIYFKQ